MMRIARIEDIPAGGLIFTYREGPFDEEGILLRLPGGGVRAYKNECRHLPMRLGERTGGEIWDAERSRLVCSSHGAVYRPADGLCIAGPCRGSHLRTLPVEVRDGEVWLDTARLGAFFRAG